MFLQALLAIVFFAAPASASAQEPKPVCPLPTGRLTIADLRALARAASEADLTIADAVDRVKACGVRFVRSALAELPPTIPGELRSAAANASYVYERDRAAGLKLASERRRSESWQEFLKEFPDGPGTAEARATAEKAPTFATLIGGEPIRSGEGEGFNNLEFFLLNVLRDEEYLRVVYRVRARSAGRLQFDSRVTERAGSFGHDDSGRPLYVKSSFLNNRLGEPSAQVGIADGDVVYLDLVVEGALPDAKAITLFAYPFLRPDYANAEMNRRDIVRVQHLNWVAPITEGAKSAVDAPRPANDLRAAVEAGPLAEWSCTGLCGADYAYFGPYSSPGRPTDRLGRPYGLESLQIRFFGVIRTTLGSLDGASQLVAIYGLTNGAKEAQLLIPHQSPPPQKPGGFIVRGSLNVGFLLSGSDDLQHQVALYPVGLFDARFRAVSARLWLTPGATAYLALEIRGADPRATEVSLYGKLLVNRTDSMKLRLPAAR